MSLLVFIAILSILIIVHEWGHFITAKSLGVKVEKFSVGFGPKLFSTTKDGTEFMVCAIPMGGYVKMSGDERSNCKGTPDEFYAHPVWHRALIVLMGPIINFVFAYLCFYAIFVTGFPMLSPTVGNVMEGYPAMTAGLLEGDRILRINQKEINGWDELQETIVGSGDESLLFGIERDGTEMTVPISPQQRVVKNIFGQEAKISIVGIQPAGDITLLRYGVLESFVKAYQEVVKIVSMTLKAVYHVVAGSMPAKDAFAGPIRIFDVIKDAVTEGIAYLLYITAVISASLAIFNLFPVPVLDGGHLFFLLIEAVRRKPLPAKVEETLTKIGFSLLMCLMVFVLYNDFVEVGWLENIIGFFKGLKG